MTIFNVFTLMGGIAMFLYGMDLMGKALEQTAGSKLQGILSTMTSSPIRGLLLGMAVTAVIQSSGATTVMAVGFVNSGLMELHQAISVRKRRYDCHRLAALAVRPGGRQLPHPNDEPYRVEPDPRLHRHLAVYDRQGPQARRR